jgi:hypothetical protein
MPASERFGAETGLKEEGALLLVGGGLGGEDFDELSELGWREGVMGVWNGGGGGLGVSGCFDGWDGGPMLVTR